MLKAIILFIVGFICLVKGGDWFVDGATNLAHRFHLPEILIGATVISIGTTIPEVMVSANSALTGHGEMAYGNAIGSIICNTALIAAITMTFRPAAVDKKSLRLPIVFFFIAAGFYAVNAYFFNGFSRVSGILLLLIFAAYMVFSIRGVRKTELQSAVSDPVTSPSSAVSVGNAAVSVGNAAVSSENVPSDIISLDGPSMEKKKAKPSAMPLWKVFLFLVLGAILIAVGADLLVDNGTIIAAGLGVPESVIALTVIALGTSLPELVTAITALLKGHSDLSLGNVIGANLFNLVLVSGLSVTLSPFSLPMSKTLAGMNASLLVDMPLMFIVMLIACVPALIKGKLSRWQGILLLVIYGAFMVFQFVS